jgi:hypothetical protein
VLSERKVASVEDSGGLACRDLAAAATRVRRVDEAAAIVDHGPEGPAGAGDALAERFAAALEDLGALDVGEAEDIRE